MKRAKTTAIVLAMLTAAGCMRGQRLAAPAQGGTVPEFGSTAAHASASSESEQLFNHLERADKLIGEEVLTSDHLRTGKIEDIVIDPESGQILYAVVGIGGILGVGEMRVAVPPGVFIEAKKGTVELNVDKHKLTRAPQVPRAMDPSPRTDFLNNVYGYYGQIATWKQPVATTKTAFETARTASELTGMKIQNHADLNLGKVQTLVLNVPAGREIYVVLSPATEMNLSNNYYPLPPKLLKPGTDQKNLVTDLTREKLANAPHFTKDDWSELSDTAFAQKVYQYYGQPAPVTHADLEPTGRIIRNK